jgi:hypothetical protein
MTEHEKEQLCEARWITIHELEEYFKNLDNSH